MSNEREALAEPWSALHKRLLRLGAAIIMERRHGDPIKRQDAEKQDNRLCDLAVESRNIADALAAAARAALSQPNHPETPDGSPAVGTIKRIDTPPGRPDLHEWTGHEWVPVGYSMARVGSAVGAALLDAEQRKDGNG